MEEETYKQLINSVQTDDMEKLLAQFAKWHRLTGTPDAQRGAEYIIQELKSYDIDCECYEFDGYFSDPIKSELIVADTLIASRPRSASANCPNGISGEIIYDYSSKDARLTRNEERELYSKFRGKIVLSWNFYEDYVKKIEAYGAIGLIHIWTSEEAALHEETVGPIWGTPTLDNAGQFPVLPVVGITRKDGCNIIAQATKEPLKATIHSWVEFKVAKSLLPVAFIPGKIQEYVLVSGHYDSWYEGVTDNATGNAVCLEMARVFSGLAGKMERGVKIAWWPGHSNGRYMGSTWYCDHFWQDLHDNCMGHINIDSPGSQGGTVVLPRTTRVEGARFTADLITEFLGKEPAAFLDIPRGADQAFWGVDIPFHIMYKYEPAPDKKIYSSPGSGGGWWWHTEYDSLDKVDYQLLLRDARMLTATVFRLVDAKRLPVDFDAYFDRMLAIFREVDEHSDVAFDLQPILAATVSLRDKVQRAITDIADDAKTNAVIKMVGGRLNYLMYSSCDKYHFDNTFPVKPFPGVQRVVNVYKDNTPPEKFLFTVTGFIRQRNRFVNEMRMVEKELEVLLKA
jgi:aminopeptidase YwaD